MERRHDGAHNELLAVTWLLRQGYDVFRNVSYHGDVDIIAMKDGEIALFDVKKSPLKQDGTPSLTGLKESQIKIGVKLLCVSAAGECQIIDTPKQRGGVVLQCKACGVDFQQKRGHQIYCSYECKESARPEKETTAVACMHP